MMSPFLSYMQVEPIVAVPLYVMSYIWDGDELNEKQLQKICLKTALYSIHIVGVIFDGKSPTVYIADPNSPLMIGGSMEFLSIPIRKIPKRVQPSVNFLRFDRNEFTKQTTATTVKKNQQQKRGRQAKPGQTKT